jgi:hypothetical protein
MKTYRAGISTICAAIALSTLSAKAYAAPVSVTVGDPAPATGNCLPFACPYYGGLFDMVWYQQSYLAAEFPGTILFDTLTFDISTPGAMDNSDFTIKFYYTSFYPGSLGTDRGAHLGAPLGLFGDYAIVDGTLTGDLTLSGNAVTYDPSLGNLLMDIEFHSTGNGGGTAGVASNVADYTNYAVSRVYCSNTLGCVAAPGALVTNFSYHGTTGQDVGGVTFGLSSPTVPEPESWALTIAGMALLGAGLRRRRTRVSMRYA